MQYFFAVLETLEQGEDDYVYLDCISAETFNGMRRHGTLLKCSKNERIPYVGNILKVNRSYLSPSLIERVTETRSRVWLKLSVAEEGESPNFANIPVQFVSLVAENTEGLRPELYISAPQETEPDTQQQAEKLFTVSSQGAENLDALIEELRPALSEKRKHVVAYRIGQGNCNAIVDQAEHPIVFFDLGWPIQSNSGGAPSPAPDLFSVRSGTSGPSPVVLSHWDWDHWAYALESWSYDRSVRGARPQWKSDAVERAWLASRPGKGLKLGPSHYNLIEELLRRRINGRRALHLWPATRDVHRIADLAILKCTPPRGMTLDRNNSGLAVAVRINDGAEDGWVLLPGDADFRSVPLKKHIPEVKPETLVGMVASHHGGKLDVFSIPTTTVEGARLVVSTGPNPYGHPNKQMLANYALRGWKSQVLTTEVATCVGACVPPHGVGALLVQPSSFAWPKCGCDEIPNANMSVAHTRPHIGIRPPTVFEVRHCPFDLCI